MRRIELRVLAPAVTVGALLPLLAAVALIPYGAWVRFAALRCVVGFGLGASFPLATTAIVEFTSTRRRTAVVSMLVISASLGVFLASATATSLLSLIDWRGIAALGIVPALFGIGVICIVPELERGHCGDQQRFEPGRDRGGGLPGFHVFAFCGLAVALAFTFLAPEAHGKQVPQESGAFPAAVPIATMAGPGTR